MTDHGQTDGQVDGHTIILNTLSFWSYKSSNDFGQTTLVDIDNEISIVQSVYDVFKQAACYIYS